MTGSSYEHANTTKRNEKKIDKHTNIRINWIPQRREHERWIKVKKIRRVRGEGEGGGENMRWRKGWKEEAGNSSRHDAKSTSDLEHLITVGSWSDAGHLLPSDFIRLKIGFSYIIKKERRHPLPPALPHCPQGAPRHPTAPCLFFPLSSSFFPRPMPPLHPIPRSFTSFSPWYPLSQPRLFLRLPHLHLDNYAGKHLSHTDAQESRCLFPARPGVHGGNFFLNLTS